MVEDKICPCRERFSQPPTAAEYGAELDGVFVDFGQEVDSLGFDMPSMEVLGDGPFPSHVLKEPVDSGCCIRCAICPFPAVCVCVPQVCFPLF